MTDLSKLRDMMRDHRMFASPFQNAHFVLSASSAGTWWGYYVQALRELHGRMRSVQLGLIELERKRRTVRRLESSVSPDADLDLKKAHIELDDQNHALREMHRQFALFYAHASHAREQLPVIIDAATRDQLDRDYWAAQLGQKAWSETLAGQPISADMLRMLLSLPTEMAEWLKNIAFDPDRLTPTRLEVPSFLEDELPELETITREIEGC